MPLTAKQSLPDILGHGLKVVFCGINPGASAATAGQHFLGRGNRFWPVVHLAGFTPYQIAPRDDRTVLNFGLGLTTAVERPTNRADQIQAKEIENAAPALLAKIEFYKPQYIAFLGKAAYAGITQRRKVEWGEQVERFGGARVWILPNPSGLNRGFTMERLIAAYSEFHRSLIS